MRFETKVMAALVVVLMQTPVSALPYDPYPWCALYSNDEGGGSIAASSRLSSVEQP